MNTNTLRSNGGIKCLKNVKTKTKNQPAIINGPPLIKRASLTNVKGMTVPAATNYLSSLMRGIFLLILTFSTLTNSFSIIPLKRKQVAHIYATCNRKLIIFVPRIV